jgi:hypothetical protein
MIPSAMNPTVYFYFFAGICGSYFAAIVAAHGVTLFFVNRDVLMLFVRRVT